MGVTIAVDQTRAERISRNMRMITGTLTWDSAYPMGGESVAGITKYFKSSYTTDIALTSMAGYNFEFDKTNSKIKAFDPQPWPAIVIEEQQTMATLKVTTRYPAAYIMAVSQTDNGWAMTDAGATLAANECQFTCEAGVPTEITFYTGASGTVYITYITQSWREVWDNVVTDEAGTAATHVVTLANDACAIQYCRAAGTVSFNSTLFLDKDDTAATKECELDWTDSAATTLTFLNTDAVLTTVHSYIKIPASGLLKDNWVEEETSTEVAGTNTWDYPMLLWGYAGQVPFLAGNTQRIINEGGSVGASEGYFKWRNTAAEGSAITHIGNDQNITPTGTYIKGRTWEIAPSITECYTGQDISGLGAIRFKAIGFGVQ